MCDTCLPREALANERKESIYNQKLSLHQVEFIAIGTHDTTSKLHMSYPVELTSKCSGDMIGFETYNELYTCTHTDSLFKLLITTLMSMYIVIAPVMHTESYSVLFNGLAIDPHTSTHNESHVISACFSRVMSFATATIFTVS